MRPAAWPSWLDGTNNQVCEWALCCRSVSWKRFKVTKLTLLLFHLIANSTECAFSLFFPLNCFLKKQSLLNDCLQHFTLPASLISILIVWFCCMLLLFMLCADFSFYEVDWSTATNRIIISYSEYTGLDSFSLRKITTSANTDDETILAHFVGMCQSKTVN